MGWLTLNRFVKGLLSGSSSGKLLILGSLEGTARSLCSSGGSFYCLRTFRHGLCSSVLLVVLNLYFVLLLCRFGVLFCIGLF